MNKRKMFEIMDINIDEMIRRLNDELSSRGFVTVAGKVSRSYFEQKVFCNAEETEHVSHKT